MTITQLACRSVLPDTTCTVTFTGARDEIVPAFRTHAASAHGQVLDDEIPAGIADALRPPQGTPPSPERALGAVHGAWASAIVAAGLTHSVFDQLETGPATCQELAEGAGLSGRGAQALLDGLCGLGLVTLAGDGYRNAPDASAFLVAGKPSYLGGYARFMFAEAGRWAAYPEVVRTGVPVVTDTADLPGNLYFEQLVPATAVMVAPSALAAAEAVGIADAGPISILDVGGGSGIFSAIWLSMNRQARATQVDWKNVNSIAADFVARRGVGNRFATMDGDLHSLDLGSAEYDVAVYSNIAHQEDPAANVAVLRRVRRALKPSGVLVVNDFVVRDDRSGPSIPLIFSSLMLLTTKHGATWREGDYRAWLAEAGFTEVSLKPVGTPATLILAR